MTRRPPPEEDWARDSSLDAKLREARVMPALLTAGSPGLVQSLEYRCSSRQHTPEGVCLSPSQSVRTCRDVSSPEWS